MGENGQRSERSECALCTTGYWWAVEVFGCPLGGGGGVKTFLLVPVPSGRFAKAREEGETFHKPVWLNRIVFLKKHSKRCRKGCILSHDFFVVSFGKFCLFGDGLTICCVLLASRIEQRIVPEPFHSPHCLAPRFHFEWRFHTLLPAEFTHAPVGRKNVETEDENGKKRKRCTGTGSPGG